MLVIKWTINQRKKVANIMEIFFHKTHRPLFLNIIVEIFVVHFTKHLAKWPLEIQVNSIITPIRSLRSKEIEMFEGEILFFKLY